MGPYYGGFGVRLPYETVTVLTEKLSDFEAINSYKHAYKKVLVLKESLDLRGLKTERKAFEKETKARMKLKQPRRPHD